MDSSSRGLSPLQYDLLVLLKEIPGSYVSGGTALAGYLGHRRSLDIDIFVANVEDIEIASTVSKSVAATHGMKLSELQRYAGFRRYRVDRGEESTLLDFVHEPVVQIVPVEEKPIRDGVRVDSLDDLTANKLCSVLGRSEVKDLVDLYFLADSGVDVLSYVAAAHAKDGGMEPATLAFVLRQMPTDPGELLMLRDIDSAALSDFRDGLVERLLGMAWPE
jgi:hypothetical protein